MPIDSRLRRAWESAAALFLSAELQTANTSVELALTSQNDENKLSYCRHAWAAYDSVVRVWNQLSLHNGEKAEIKARLDSLKAKIEEVKPWSELARSSGNGTSKQAALESEPRLVQRERSAANSARPSEQRKENPPIDRDARPTRARLQAD